MEEDRESFQIREADVQMVAHEVVERPLTQDELRRVYEVLEDSFKYNGRLRELVKAAIRVVAG